MEAHPDMRLRRGASSFGAFLCMTAFVWQSQQPNRKKRRTRGMHFFPHTPCIYFNLLFFSLRHCLHFSVYIFALSFFLSFHLSLFPYVYPYVFPPNIVRPSVCPFVRLLPPSPLGDSVHGSGLGMGGILPYGSVQEMI